MSTPGPPQQEPQGLTPPYQKEEGDPQQNPISRDTGKGGPETSADTYGSSTGNPPRIVSEEEKSGVGDTDLEPEPAMGAGAHITTGGEEQGGGIGQPRQDSGVEGTQGASGRPAGKHGDEQGIGGKPTETGSSMAGEVGDQSG